MKQIDEDMAYEQWRQAKIERDWDNVPSRLTSIPIHQKVGTVVPFSRMADRDPNPRIPLSVPVDASNRPNVWVTVTCIVLALLILWGVNQ